MNADLNVFDDYVVKQVLVEREQRMFCRRPYSLSWAATKRASHAPLTLAM